MMVFLQFSCNLYVSMGGGKHSFYPLHHLDWKSDSSIPYLYFYSGDNIEHHGERRLREGSLAVPLG